jgi:hypothetical protein
MAQANQHKELDKAKPRAEEYPHVYGAPSGGNILNAFGKKYALPFGTERHLEEVHIKSSFADHGSIMRRLLFLLLRSLPTLKRRLSSRSTGWIISARARSRDIKR